MGKGADFGKLLDRFPSVHSIHDDVSINFDFVATGK
jgi:hypothetical protein